MDLLHASVLLPTKSPGVLAQAAEYPETGSAQPLPTKSRASPEASRSQCAPTPIYAGQG